MRSPCHYSFFSPCPPLFCRANEHKTNGQRPHSITTCAIKKWIEGAMAGKLTKDHAEMAENYHYFIKVYTEISKYYA